MLGQRVFLGTHFSAPCVNSRADIDGSGGQGLAGRDRFFQSLGNRPDLHGEPEVGSNLRRNGLPRQLRVALPYIVGLGVPSFPFTRLRCLATLVGSLASSLQAS